MSGGLGAEQELAAMLGQARGEEPASAQAVGLRITSDTHSPATGAASCSKDG
jgi:hypothetical protein